MSSAASTDVHNGAHGLEHGLERFRAVRREPEAAMLPPATSLDGRRFTYQASLHGLALRLGGYVVVEYDGGQRVGQVLELEPAQASDAELDVPREGEDGVRAWTLLDEGRVPSVAAIAASTPPGVPMRLKSAADTAFAPGVFSFMPRRLVEQAATFRLGKEGGSDVPTWTSATG